LLALTRERRVVGVGRRVWSSGQMMEAKRKVERLDELEAWRTGHVAEEKERN
jgi:hypothetical protein